MILIWFHHNIKIKHIYLVDVYPTVPVLCLVTLQTSVTVLVLRWTRTHDSGAPYIATSLVFTSECVK